MKWFILMLVLAGCDNTMARSYGGKEVIELSPGDKLVNVTWKVNDLWILTRDSRPGEEPETYAFYEKSNFGLLEGVVVLKEKAKK